MDPTSSVPGIPNQSVDMAELLRLMGEKRASDLHITVGMPPTFRIDGLIVTTPFEKLQPEQTQKMIYSLLTDTQKQKFESMNELDVSFGIKGVGRVRMNVYRQRGAVAGALRAIPNKILGISEIGLPSIILDILKIPKGLILVTGPTGSGKSTTLAAMINHLNESEQYHIMTIEDPIEFIHYHKKSIINQREVGSDTQSFNNALKYVLRQDPDIILVGEMRDLETISAAISIAETGHLVFGTLHTTDAIQSINRIIDVFPPHQQQQIRIQLSFVLQAVISQMLIPKSSGIGRVLATEVLVATPAIRNLIREGKIEQIMTTLQTGAKFGMQTLNSALADLYNKRVISHQDAISASMDVEDLKRLIQRTNEQRSTIGH